MTDENDTKSFRYIMAIQNEFCLISFVGSLDKNAVPDLLECMDKIKNSDCKFYIFNFRDIDAIENSVYRSLTQIQHVIRKEKKQILRLCGIHPGWKVKMIEDAVIRQDETLDNIRLALTELNTFKK